MSLFNLTLPIYTSEMAVHRRLILFVSCGYLQLFSVGAAGPGTCQYIRCRICGTVRSPYSSRQSADCWLASWQVRLSVKFY